MRKAIIPVIAVIIAAAALVISIVAISIACSDHAFVSELRSEFAGEEPTIAQIASDPEYDEMPTAANSRQYDDYDSDERPTAMAIPHSGFGE